MTFPAVETEQEDDESPAVQDPCAACDGSGLSRRIDGYVFVCQHCCIEMT
jgi:hypothetical protein